MLSGLFATIQNRELVNSWFRLFEVIKEIMDNSAIREWNQFKSYLCGYLKVSCNTKVGLSQNVTVVVLLFLYSSDDNCNWLRS